MAIVCSVCVAVLVCLMVFPKEFKTTDLSPIIFLLGLVLLATLCASDPDAFSRYLENGPSKTLTLGAGMLLLFAFSGTSTFQVLKKMPASAYKAIAPAAISVGIIILLTLTAIL